MTEDKKEKQIAKVKDAAMRIANSEDGKLFLRYLCDSCGMFRSSVSLSSLNELNLNSTLYNEGRRSVYIMAVRPLIKGSIALNNIERPEVT